MKYIDLGLPSGTKWAEKNEEGFYTFEEAVKKFGHQLPSRDQLEELCTLFHRWDEKRQGMEFSGNNGNKLYLPASGGRYGTSVFDVGARGRYWSTTAVSSYNAYYIYFYSHGLYTGLNNSRRAGFAVRLVSGQNNSKLED